MIASFVTSWLAALCGLFALQWQLAADLRPGLQLVYASEGKDQPPWTIDSVATALSLRPNSDCARVHLRRQPDQRVPEELRVCISGDTLFAWDSARRDWTAQRPVGPGMSITSVRQNGDTVRYTTEGMVSEIIDGQSVRGVRTIVLTVSSTGTPKRRLEERYAPTLVTALGGRFAVPDSLDPSGWRVTQAFELRRMYVPR